MDKPNYNFDNLGMEPVRSVKYFVPDILDYIEKLCESTSTTDLQRHFLYSIADLVAVLPSYTFYECSPENFDVRGILEFLEVHNLDSFNLHNNLITFFFGHEE